MACALVVLDRVYLTVNNDRPGRKAKTRAGCVLITVKDRIRAKRANTGLNGSIWAIMAIRARLGRANLTLMSTALKGRPEQGITARTSRNGPYTGDTGCGHGGTDQRAMVPGISGPGDEPGQSVHRCSPE